MRLAAALLLLSTLAALGATRYVATNGVDTGSAATWGTAWRSLGYAAANADNGDTIEVGAGDYQETVTIDTKAQLTFLTSSNAAFEQLYINTRSNTFSGFDILHGQARSNVNDAFILLGTQGSCTTISNCFIGDMPMLTAKDFTFNRDTDTIYSPSVDFIAAGFRTNANIYWGGNSLTNGWYANMCKNGVVTGVTSNTLYIADGAITEVETNTHAWSVIFPGSGYGGLSGVAFSTTGPIDCTNCTFINNTFTNFIGPIIAFQGYGHTFKGNTVVRQMGASGFRLQGANHVVISNYIHDSILPIYYSAWEHNSGMIWHPAGGGRYDFIAGYNHDGGSGKSTEYSSNNIIAWNWYENIEQDMGQMTPVNTLAGAWTNRSHGMTIVSNVFCGFSGSWSGGWDDLIFSRNTFYRCAINEGELYVLTLGSSGITNVTVANNIFIDCGDHSNTNSEGWFTLSNGYGTVSTNDNVRLPPDAVHGSVVLLDPGRPTGADGIPFTDDDGLRPIAGGPLANAGALAPLTPGSSRSVPFFTSYFSNYTRTNIAWTVNGGSNYNPAWQAMSAEDRPTIMKPYATPWVIGDIPTLVRFEATNSVSGTWSTNDWAGIRDFVWNFGDDSRPVWTRWPDVSHTYTTTGAFWVTLTVTNSAGNASSCAERFSVTNVSGFAGDIFYVATNGSDANPGTFGQPFLTITNAIKNASAGDYISIAPGEYLKSIRYNAGGVSGTPTAPITVVGHNSSIWGIYQEVDWWTWEGMDFRSTNIAAGLWAAFDVGGQSGIRLRNNWFHDGEANKGAIRCTSSGTNLAFYNNLIERMIGGTFGAGFKFTGQTNIVIDGNIEQETTGQGDFIQINASDVTISRNFLYHLSGTGHPDCFQIPLLYEDGEISTNQIPTRNIVFERNWCQMDPVDSLAAQMAQISSGVQSNLTHTNIVWRNNVFVDVRGQLNDSIDGLKFYNNLFYHCVKDANQFSTGGGTNGSSLGTEWYNNIFLACGTNQGVSASAGWYENGLKADIAYNTTVWADYNFVCGSNYVAKQEAPPNDYLHWKAVNEQMALETHGINGGNPLFSDVDTLDFRLATNSPLLAAGVVVSGFNTDFFGRVRPASWAIGPFEVVGYQEGPSAPFIVTGPQNVSKYVGQTATFTVTATGDPPLAYQWSWYSTNVTGATASSWTTPTLVLENNASSVFVGVTNAVGGVVSSTATITMQSLPQVSSGAAQVTTIRAGILRTQ